MIVLAIAALSTVVIAALVATFVGIPSLPDGVVSIVESMLTYFDSGCRLFYSFCYGEIVAPLVTFLVAVTAVYEGYKLVMWIVKKIPMLGVSD